ncbi:hypothetical protein [Kitasatospora viridis]|uniref:Ig-like domain-containing protein n=1 Tax=Kitasatospora viridis TaxID=281105 RepID=A0A561SFM9_9ACTN|nr:hypothetical protein [Kitasatospora viridis]TWF73659.1 hypothetical protein FHX73_15275 [Kitasatospora viridis]
MTRSAARLAAPLLLALAAFGVATPAHADTTLTAGFGTGACTDDGLMPGKVNVDEFDCSAWASGGTGSYTYAFSGVVNATFRGYMSPDDGWGICNLGQHTTVEVTVTDSAGDTATAQTSFLCGEL